MKNLTKLFLFILLFVHFCSCTQDALLNNNTVENATTPSLTKEQAITQFSEILSKATYNEPSLRAFLKDQALMMKDNDHNVFYPLTKNEIVSENKTFYQVLEKYAGNKHVLKNIEKSFPLLNIFIPDLTLLDKSISVENLDPKEKNIPIFSTGKLYLNGVVIDSITEENQDALPVFHTFVVNESHRRIIKNETRSSNNSIKYGFANDLYDPSKNKVANIKTRFDGVNSEINENLSELLNPNNDFVSIVNFPSETLSSFYKIGNGNGVLRPMMYYNLNNIRDLNSDNATLDYNVSDAIYRLKIDPETYSRISHFNYNGFLSPYIKFDYTKKHRTMKNIPDYDEIVRDLWSDGSYHFLINIVTGEYSQLIPFSIRPQDLFSVTIHQWFKHKTWFTDARFEWYAIKGSLKSKWIYPHLLENRNLDFRFSSWNPKQESYKRNIYISIAGSDAEFTTKVQAVSSVVKKKSSSTSVGIDFPIDDVKASIKISDSWEAENSFSDTKEVTIKVTDRNVPLGNNWYSFFSPSPIVRVENNKVYLETQKFGCFDMCIIPVRGRLKK